MEKGGGGGTTIEVRPGVSSCDVVIQGLTEIVRQTISKLEGVWDEVGCSKEERSQHLQGKRERVG